MADPAIYRPFLAMLALTRPPNLWHYSRRLFYPIPPHQALFPSKSRTTLCRSCARCDFLAEERRQREINIGISRLKSSNGWAFRFSATIAPPPDSSWPADDSADLRVSVVSLNGATLRGGRLEEKCWLLISRISSGRLPRGKLLENVILLS